MDRAIAGEFTDLATALDDDIDAWHEAETFVPALHEWLGFTWDEYVRWVQSPRTLDGIVAARRVG